MDITFAQKRAKDMGMNYVGRTDGPVGEFLTTSADKPVTVVSGEYSTELKDDSREVGTRVTVDEKSAVTYGRVERVNL